MKIGVGLIVKGGKEFIEKWIKGAEQITTQIFVVDNEADVEVKNILINHPKVKQYHIQKGMERNQSRDYQKLLNMAREEDCNWMFNIDIDEIIPEVDVESFVEHLLNTTDESVGFPLVEMRDNDNTFMHIPWNNDGLKQARLCHKCYKILSHFEFNQKDVHGISIPHNCKAGTAFPMPIKHYGHYTKKLRDEKKKYYSQKNFKDVTEKNAPWLDDKVKLGDFNELAKGHFPIVKIKEEKK